MAPCSACAAASTTAAPDGPPGGPCRGVQWHPAARWTDRPGLPPVAARLALVSTTATTSEAPRPLVLLDGHSLAYRAFFALPSDLATTTGQLTNAVYGFTLMLVKLFGELAPERIAVCFDAGMPAFRSELYQDYKANRQTTPDEFRSQMPLIREVLAALHIPVVEVPGNEADDVIATLVEQAKAEGMPVVVVTGDRDLLQLIDDQASVQVMMTSRGVTDTRTYDAAGVEQRYGVPPERYADLAALRGDTSDNVPGVPGVGDKTAAKLVKAYGSAEEVVAHADEQRGKLRENLGAHGAEVLRNKQLVTLHRDIPLPVSASELRMGPWDRSEIHRLFDTLEFQGLRSRLFETTAAQPAAADAGFEVEARRLGPGELAGWLAAVPADGQLALACRMTTGPGRAELLGLALWAEGTEAAWLDLDGAGPDDLDALAALLADPERPKLVHDAKQLYLAVGHGGGSSTGSRSTPRSPPTWPSPASRPTTCPTSPCATSARSYALRGRRPPAPLPARAPSSPSTPRRPTSSGRSGACAPRPLASWPRPSPTRWPSWASSASTGTWSCRWCRSWPSWSAPASRSTCRCSRRSATGSTRACSTARRASTSWRGRSSTSARTPSCS